MTKAKSIDVKIIFEGGEQLSNRGVNKYYELTDKISALIKETYPQVRYCDVETWGMGYYAKSVEKRVDESLDRLSGNSEFQELVHKTMSEVLREPEMQELIRAQCDAIPEES